MSNVPQTSPRFDQRPWGTFTVLDEGDSYKVKRIEVFPEKRVSYQKHAQRAEHWMIVAGHAKDSLNESSVSRSVGQTIDIPIGAAHRSESIGTQNLVFSEKQRGNYLGEDDIERLQNDYGR